MRDSKEKAKTRASKVKARDGNGATKTQARDGNGASKAKAKAKAASKTPAKSQELETHDEHLARAEELVDKMLDRASHYAGVVSHGLSKWVARTREDLEDVWAEAQALRHRDGD